MTKPSRAERYITIKTPSGHEVYIGRYWVQGITLLIALGTKTETAFDTANELENRSYDIDQAIAVCKKSDHPDATWLSEEIRTRSDAIPEKPELDTWYAKMNKLMKRSKRKLKKWSNKS